MFKRSCTEFRWGFFLFFIEFFFFFYTGWPVVVSDDGSLFWASDWFVVPFLCVCVLLGGGASLTYGRCSTGAAPFFCVILFLCRETNDAGKVNGGESLIGPSMDLMDETFFFFYYHFFFLTFLMDSGPALDFPGRIAKLIVSIARNYQSMET